jgi:two-component system, OmpR family, sensor kinase
MATPFHQRLYLRIWLAVVAAIAVVTLIASWLWQIETERNRVERERERAERPGREIIVRNQAGEILGQAPIRIARVPGQQGGPEFLVAMKDGSNLIIQLPRPNRPAGAPGTPGALERTGAARQLGLPFSSAWMLAFLALAVAVGTYPIVRRLTKRLEAVQTGVQRWGQGDLSTRLAEDGQDEVAFLAQRFNHSAEQIQTLLTDQKTLLASQTALLASQKSLLANASHELRSPLARIRMGLELDQASAVTVAQKKSLKAEINRNINELDQLIEEILLASRLDAQEADLGTVESVDLVGLAAEECARVGAELEVQTTSSEELVVKGVSKLLRRALRNLLENAGRHGANSSGAGEITVTLRTMQSDALICVCDRGPGVPAAYQERIFEPFFRLPGASEQSGGVGLGLALVKSIASRHGGSVSCENRLQGGACFVIRLPLQPVTNPLPH